MLMHFLHFCFSNCFFFFFSPPLLNIRHCATWKFVRFSVTIKCPSPHGQGRRRESQKQMGTQVKDSKGEMSFLEPPRAVSGEPQPPCPGMRPIKIQYARAPFGLRGADAWGMGHIMGCRGKAFQDCIRLTVRKRRDKEIKGAG